MGGWISVGLGAAAALCPLSPHGDSTVTIDHTPSGAHMVVCAPDVWVDMGHGARASETPRPVPASTRQPPSPCAPAPAGRAPVSEPPRQAPREVPAPPSGTPRPAPPAQAPAAAPPVPREADPPARVESAPAPAATPVRAAASAPPKAPPAFRWVPRAHYTGGPRRPAFTGTPTTMTTVVVTTPAILAAAALRPSRRRTRD